MMMAGTFAIRMILLGASLCAIDATAAEESQPVIVPEITKVQYVEEEINPPNLVVSVTGNVPTGGYSNVMLIRAHYVTPPADGIQDYYLTATPPREAATQVITPVSASNRWKKYTSEAPWLKGVRIHGSGNGVMVKMLSNKGAAEAVAKSRLFEGESPEGDLQKALQAALGKLDKALAEGNVADASATWKITQVSGTRGGITGARGVNVTISAIRTPEWP